MKIFLPNSASLQNFEGFLRRFSAENEDVLEFEMHPKWVNVHPAAIAFTACAADYVSSKGGRHEGIVHPVRSLPYVKRMKLFDFLRLDAGNAVIEHEEAGRFIPLKRITSPHDLSDFIVNMIPLLHAKPEEVEPIRYVISELTRNVLEHSRSENGAFICAQYYKDSKTLSLGIADAGVGLRQALSHSHKPESDWDALRLAMYPGITGTTKRIGGNDYNAGAGLFFTKSIASASRKYFLLYSGTSLFKLLPTKAKDKIVLQANAAEDHHTKREDMPFWRGTLVGIDLSIKQDIPFTQLMGLIRGVFSVDVKRQKKDQYRKARFT
jgi:hypothetical protein